MPVVATFVKENTSVIVATWAGMDSSDTGAHADLGAYTDKTVTVTGTFGAAGSVTIEGSNDGTNFFTMNDYLGTDATFTSAGMMLLMENPRYIRARTTAGDGTTNLTVKISASLR